MSASDDLAIEPVPNEAIRRTEANEDEDLNAALDNAANEAYLNWPNEGGFDHLDEHRGPIELNVQGIIPSWAVGSLFRTGPGLRRIDNTPKGTLQLSHWFDGLAHTHRFDIEVDRDTHKTKVIYSSRRQCDDFVNYVRENGLNDMITFGQKSDPCVGLFAKVKSSWSAAKPDRETKQLENAGVTVQLGVPGLASSTSPQNGHPARQTVWLGTDAHFLRELDPQTLEPIGFVEQKVLHPGLDGPLTCAHAERCPLTGDYFNVNIKGGPKPTYKVFQVSAATGKTEILAEISSRDLPLAYIHSFYLSQNFVVLRVPSSHFSAHGLSILWKKNLLEAMEPFNNKKQCRWFVIDRTHGRGLIAQFKTDAAFFFHTVNCFELPRQDPNVNPEYNLCVDTIEYSNMDILDALRYDVLMNTDGKAKASWSTSTPSSKLPRFVRKLITIRALGGPGPSQSFIRRKYGQVSYTMKMGAEAVARTIRQLSPERLAWLNVRYQNPPLDAHLDASCFEDIEIPTPHIGELPTINPAYHTKPYRYVYSLAMGCRSTFVDTIVKTDLSKCEALQWNNPVGHTPGEAIFVARPRATDEDDGVLLSVVLDGTCNKSYLLCLDATTMQEMGRAEMDFAVGFGFHGVHTIEA